MGREIPEAKIQEILDSVNIVDVISPHVQLRRQGSRMVGLCPFHQEKTPSFSVTPDKGLFYCFGCQKGGTAVHFLMEIEGLSFPESLEKLASLGGVSLPRDEDRPRTEEEKHQEALLELYRRIAGTFHYFLTQDQQGSAAREYLEGRGISTDTIRTFQLGFAPDDRYWLYHFLRKRNYSADFLSRSALFSRRYPEISLFSGRLIFPIKDHRGRIVGFGGRLLRGEGPKYINSPESSLYQKNKVLYGLSESLPEIRKSREFVLTEGYFDVISLYQGGVPGAVAPLGTAFTDGQAALLKRFARRGILWFDSDSAGVEAAFKASRLLERQGVETKAVQQEKGKDPADILEKEGPGALKKIKKYPINTFEYLLNRAVNQEGRDTPEQKEGVIRRIFSYIEAVDSPTRQDGYIQELAEQLFIDPDAVRQGFRQRKMPEQKNNSGRGPGNQEGKNPQNVPQTPDQLLMVAVWANLEYFEYVRSRLAIADLEDPRAREVYILLEEAYRRDQLKPEVLLEQLDPEERESILRRISSGEFDENGEQYIKDTVRSIKIRSLEHRRKEIESRIRYKEWEARQTEKGSGTEPADQEGNGLKDLLLEKMYLDGELKKIRVNTHDR